MENERWRSQMGRVEIELTTEQMRMLAPRVSREAAIKELLLDSKILQQVAYIPDTTLLDIMNDAGFKTLELIKYSRKEIIESIIALAFNGIMLRHKCTKFRWTGMIPCTGIRVCQLCGEVNHANRK